MKTSKMGASKMLLALLGLTASLSACGASPELQKLCKEYVDQQVRGGHTNNADKALQSCLRLTPEQVRCLKTAKGRNAKIACTQ